MKDSFICVYCNKNIHGSRKTHLRSHVTKIISLFLNYITETYAYFDTFVNNFIYYGNNRVTKLSFYFISHSQWNLKVNN